jgi:ProP effector
MAGEGQMADRKEKTEQTIAELIAAFPLAFSTEPEQIKPLGIGIKQRIYAQWKLSHREIDHALRHYTGQVDYLRTVIEGAVRVDLDGTANGTVTAKEAAYAAEHIKKLLAIAAGKPKDKVKPKSPAKGTSPQPPALPGASKPGPRRLSLADLKQAAAARQTQKKE